MRVSARFVACRLLPHAAPRAVPEDIDVFEGEDIAAMACGLCVHPLCAIIVALQRRVTLFRMHSVVVSRSGLAYGFGCAKGGMLGLHVSNW
jgi:hypothetical protein